MIKTRLNTPLILVHGRGMKENFWVWEHQSLYREFQEGQGYIMISVSKAKYKGTNNINRILMLITRYTYIRFFILIVIIHIFINIKISITELFCSELLVLWIMAVIEYWWQKLSLYWKLRSCYIGCWVSLHVFVYVCVSVNVFSVHICM